MVGRERRIEVKKELMIGMRSVQGKKAKGSMKVKEIVLQGNGSGGRKCEQIL